MVAACKGGAQAEDDNLGLGVVDRQAPGPAFLLYGEEQPAEGGGRGGCGGDVIGVEEGGEGEG